MRLDRIKMITLLMEKDWNINKLSEQSGVSRVTISYIKNGKNCSDEVGIKIAKALNVRVQDLLEE